jgi:hypothetical protein
MRVAAITFSNGVYPEDSFNLSTYTNKTEMLTHLKNLHHQRDSRTDTHAGIRYMRSVQMAEARPCAHKVAILMTHGTSSE